MTRLALSLSALLFFGCSTPALETEPAPDSSPSVELQEAPLACSEAMWREGAAGLQVATKAFLQDGAVVVGVLGITDTRCPDDVVCVQPGEATARLAIQTDGEVFIREVAERESTTFDGYELTVMDISRADTPEMILGLFEFEAAVCPVTI